MINISKGTFGKTDLNTDMRVPGCVSTGVAERSYPTPEFRGGGREELPHARGQGQRLKGAAPHPRSGSCAGAGGLRGATPHSRSGVMTSSKVRNSGVLCWSSHGEIPHIQGKRNPRKMVGIARGHQKADTLKP